MSGSMSRRFPAEWLPARRGRLHRLALSVAAPLGLIDPIESWFGIRSVLPDDIYVVSYPRSGNTWMRYVMAYLIRGTAERLHPADINEIAPDAYVHADSVNARGAGRIIKIHEPFLDTCPRVVHIVRDWRAAAVSYWHFSRRLHRYPGTFSEFIRSPHPDRHGSWKAHARARLRRIAASPHTIQAIRYEDLVADFRGTVAGLVDWWGVGKGVDLAEVEARTSPAALAEGAARDEGIFKQLTGESFFVDRGKGADWRSIWSEEDLAWLARDRELTWLMARHGYH